MIEMTMLRSGLVVTPTVTCYDFVCYAVTMTSKVPAKRALLNRNTIFITSYFEGGFNPSRRRNVTSFSL